MNGALKILCLMKRASHTGHYTLCEFHLYVPVEGQTLDWWLPRLGIGEGYWKEIGNDC